MEECIFCKIVKHEMESNILFEDKDVVVFPDIHPRAPFHILIVSKKHITDASKLHDEHLWFHILEVVQKFIEKEKLTNRGFRLVINGGGAQLIDHLHIHLMGEISAERTL